MFKKIIKNSLMCLIIMLSTYIMSACCGPKMCEITVNFIDVDEQLGLENYTETIEAGYEVIVNIDGVVNTDVDLLNLTEEQQEDVKEVLEIYMQNPAAAKSDAEEIKAAYEAGTPINEIRNKYYAELVNLSKSPNTYPLVKNVIQGVAYEKVEN